VAGSHGIEIRVVRVDIRDRAGLGLEAAARRARYAAVAEAMAPGSIALAAHHADDQAETVLLRLMRGAGPGALGGMRPLRALAPGWLARPWLALPRRAIRAYAERHRLEWLDDPSNAVPQQDRNFLRLDVMPRLESRWPDAVGRVGRSAALLRAASGHLAREVDEAAQACRGSEGTLRIEPLKQLDDFLLGEVVRAWLSQHQLPPPPSPVLARVRSELIESRPDSSARLAWRGAALRRYRICSTSWSRRLPRTRAGSAPGMARRARASGGARHAGARAAAPAPARRQAAPRWRADRARPEPAFPIGEAPAAAAGMPPWQRARLPLLWHGDALWAVGADLRAHAFDAWLEREAARLLWQRSR
jgi:tRNA(Ile)-lysidine synthase